MFCFVKVLIDSLVSSDPNPLIRDLKYSPEEYFKLHESRLLLPKGLGLTGSESVISKGILRESFNKYSFSFLSLCLDFTVGLDGDLDFATDCFLKLHRSCLLMPDSRLHRRVINNAIKMKTEQRPTSRLQSLHHRHTSLRAEMSSNFVIFANFPARNYCKRSATCFGGISKRGKRERHGASRSSGRSSARHRGGERMWGNVTTFFESTHRGPRSAGGN